MQELLSASKLYQVEVTNEMLDGTVIIGVSAEFKRSAGQILTAASDNVKISYSDSVSVFANNKRDIHLSIFVVCMRPDNKLEITRSQAAKAPIGRYSRYANWRLRPARSVDGASAASGPAPIELVRAPD